MTSENNKIKWDSKLTNPPHHHWYKRWWGVIILIILFFLISFTLASIFYIYKTINDIQNNQASILTAEKPQEEKEFLEGKNNYWLGTSTPKITIIEFSDFACPYCQENFSIIRELGIKYQEQVKIIYRDYLGHESSLDLAMAGRCAGEQQKFWNMHDKIFTNQNEVNLNNLPTLAQQIGLDVESFKNCLKNQKYLSQIQEDMLAAQELGITATPTWIINGYLIKGAIDRENFIKIIEDILNK